MGLRDYKAPKETITFEGGCFDIRGISFSNLSTLIRNNFSDLETVYRVLADSSNEGDETGDVNLQEIVACIVTNCPNLIARVIAMAAGEDDEEGIEAAYSLSFPTQIDIVLRIIKLSFYEVGGVKKFISEMSGKMALALPKALAKK